MFNVNEITVEEIKAQIETEIQNLDWKGYKVEIQDDIPFLVQLSVVGKGANNPLCKTAAVTNPDLNTTTFYAEVILDQIKHNPLNKIFLKKGIIGWFVRKLSNAHSIEEAYKQIIHQLVIHENRHVHQFAWIKEHADIVNVDEVIEAESKSLYGMGTLEKDAFRYQSKEKNIPFEEVFKKFIHTAA